MRHREVYAAFEIAYTLVSIHRRDATFVIGSFMFQVGRAGPKRLIDMEASFDRARFCFALRNSQPMPALAARIARLAAMGDDEDLAQTDRENPSI